MTAPVKPLYGEQTALSIAGSSVDSLLTFDWTGISATKINKTALGDAQKTARNSSQPDGGEFTATAFLTAGNISTYKALVLSGAESACVATVVDTAGNGETWTWAKCVVKSVKPTGLKEDGNVEYEVTGYFNDFPATAAFPS